MKIMLFTALSVSSLLCIVSNAAVTAQSADEESIVEAVFRYQLEHCYKNRDRLPKMYFLSRNNKDLSDKFMERFKDHTLPVRKRSQVDAEAKAFCFVDKESGECGIILNVQGIKLVSDTEAEVEGGCIAGGRDGYGYMYRMMREKGKWAIKSSRGTWVS